MLRGDGIVKVARNQPREFVTVPATTTHQRKQRVLVFCLSGLGDAILASPALAALSAMSDRYQLTLLTMFGSVTEYLRDQRFTPDVRHADFLGMSKVAILKQALPLRRERFAVSVLPYAMNRLGYNFLSRVVGARQRFGFRYQRQRWINAPHLNQCVIEEDPTLHAVEENLRWFTRLTGQPRASVADVMICRIGPEAAADAAAFLAEHQADQAAPLIGLHASCNSLKNQQHRCWPAARFGELIQRLGDDWPGARFLLFEGPQDAAINRAILAQVGAAARQVTVVRQMPLRVVSALIRRCQLFVSNDSGLMHMAAACKVPCVALFGPTNPAWVRPWKTSHVVISRRLPCSPCFAYSSRPLVCPAHLDFACMREISVTEVQSAARSLLAPTHAQPTPAQL